MKSGFMRLDTKDGRKIALNFVIGTFITTVGGSCFNGLPNSIEALITILIGGLIAAATSLGRRLATNSQDQLGPEPSTTPQA